MEDILDRMGKAAQGEYLSFEDGDEKVVEIIGEPVESVYEQNGQIVLDKAGLPKPQFLTPVRVDGKVSKWSIMSKQVLQQLRGEMIAARKRTFTSTRWRVIVQGDGVKRKYFIKLLPARVQGQVLRGVTDPGMIGQESRGIDPGMIDQVPSQDPGMVDDQ